ncbi:thiamine phosphate synthase [Elizabethkingia anophelis]|uniref:thiamine phosphate synthase n=1 Tax=Elizabethkingia anophelis TaxID=1117645 RepID=UPI0020131320|nr:thiamine phosphate synthase [Elizabethkingia anophelis]MCL1690787.1 thiamine phosphate synthase [Elizabethkingia anophelis]MDV3572773.1 thiamine phosphate synthase [Elizabethkingia anophelis]MDV3599909.1 thiamine phosphate synthase [Elizabethkingia anophelis]MDV3605829.1 thiamine phosphate synthase [Elizabethkingia anophelis]MDV3638788.1 thiamine phosphate synthase [Elizabethkingia anophelis]
MIIVLSPEQEPEQEVYWINELLAGGLDYFHVRKYWLSEEAMCSYISQINEDYRDRLILHSHYNLAEEFGIVRLHFREESRLNKEQVNFQGKYILSTSTHSIEEFNTLGKEWTYAFLSPVFPSISKQGYGAHCNVLNDLKQRTNKNVQLVGLGGIDEHNIDIVLKSGVDGVAMLGNIWQSSNPLQVFLNCKNKFLNQLQNQNNVE